MWSLFSLFTYHLYTYFDEVPFKSFVHFLIVDCFLITEFWEFFICICIRISISTCLSTICWRGDLFTIELSSFALLFKYLGCHFISLFRLTSYTSLVFIVVLLLITFLVLALGYSLNFCFLSLPSIKMLIYAQYIKFSTLYFRFPLLLCYYYHVFYSDILYKPSSTLLLCLL